MLMHFLKQLLPGRQKQHWTAALISVARGALHENDLSGAERAVESILAKNPMHAEAIFLRGLIAYRRQDFASALTAFRTAISLEPDHPDYLFQIAVCQAMLGNVSQAENACQIAIGANPYDPRAHALLSEMRMPGPFYTDILADIHRHLAPRTYLEIGVESGRTLALAGKNTTAIGVDPEPKIRYPLGTNAQVYSMTSDDFFAKVDLSERLDGRPVDLAFIDGMHHFEFALRDFCAIERYCTPQSTILVHDCYPLDRQSAERNRVTTFWSGDIWRLVLALKKHRPELTIHTIATPPTGLAIIRALDPQSRVLADHMDEIIAEFLATDYSILTEDKPGKLNLTSNQWSQIEQVLT
jgi:hypothetical protein